MVSVQVRVSNNGRDEVWLEYEDVCKAQKWMRWPSRPLGQLYAWRRSLWP